MRISDTSPFQDSKANMALKHAYEWALEKAESSVYADAAKAYIESIDLNRYMEVGNDRLILDQETHQKRIDYADSIQLVYINSNLSYWRGEKAKQCKKILKEYAQILKSPRKISA